MSADSNSFETLRSALSALEVPIGHARRLHWVVESLLGVARTSSGDFEIFLLGEPLDTRSPLVRRCLQHGAWKPATGGSAFDATRVVLPADPHFAAIAALIATELVGAGLGTGVSLQDAFSEVEPIIELAIQRGSLTDEMLLGLFSELLVLLTILRTAHHTPERKAILVSAWRGWQQGRDFVFAQHAIEVKATRNALSRHTFSGLHQLEEQVLPDGNVEVLHLLSIGLKEVPSGGESLPNVVDDLLAELGAPVEVEQDLNPLQTQLLFSMSRYGAGGRGYRHLAMREWPQYQARFAVSFSPRLYRISDKQMKLLPRTTVADTFVQPDSLTFEAEFPAQVSAFNPAANWQTEIAEMVRAMH